MELLALAISLVALAISIILLYQSRHQVVDVHLVYEILPVKKEDVPAVIEDGSRALVQEPSTEQLSAEQLAGWKNITGIPFGLDYGKPQPPIVKQPAPPLSRPAGFV